jgi:hypothetical protein
VHRAPCRGLVIGIKIWHNRRKIPSFARSAKKHSFALRHNFRPRKGGKAPSILVASHLLNLYQCSVILHESILVSKQLEARKMTSKFITQCADKFHNSNTKQAASSQDDDSHHYFRPFPCGRCLGWSISFSWIHLSRQGIPRCSTQATRIYGRWHWLRLQERPRCYTLGSLWCRSSYF